MMQNLSENVSMEDLDSGGYIPYMYRPETYIVPVVFAMIFIVGVLGNGTLVLVFVRHRTMRNMPNTYIFSLALGDLLVIITCVPFTSTLYTLETWPYGTLICKMSECIKDVSIGVSVFTLTALSAERYCAIVNPIRRHVGSGQLSTKLFTMFTALGIWAVAVVLALPAALYSHLQLVLLPNNHTIEVCMPFPDRYIFDMPYNQFMVLSKFLMYYAVPLAIIAFFYILMARHLVLSTRNMPGELQAQSTQAKARKKVAKMVLAFVIMFSLCFLPYHIFMLWFHFYENATEDYNAFWHSLRIVGFCFSFINSCINPIALYCVSGTFRKYFNHYLFCCIAGNQLKRRGTGTVCETSSHTLVHFNSTVRRHDTINCSIATTNTNLFNTDKT